MQQRCTGSREADYENRFPDYLGRYGSNPASISRNPQPVGQNGLNLATHRIVLLVGIRTPLVDPVEQRAQAPEQTGVRQTSVAHLHLHRSDDLVAYQSPFVAQGRPPFNRSCSTHTVSHRYSRSR
jgi:hypothetical protein